MSEELGEGRGQQGRKKRGTRGKLKKSQEIDHVFVEETFLFQLPDHIESKGGERRVGEGCYVSATVNNRRYYGLLVDQAALKNASMLYFQDEAAGLNLNRKIEALMEQKPETANLESVETNERKRPATSDMDIDESKRSKTSLVSSLDDSSTFKKITSLDTASLTPRQVQKFRYVKPQENGGKKASLGYRILLATYADVAAAGEDDPERCNLIDSACQSGGNFVGEYFYQYEPKASTLETSKALALSSDNVMHTSIGFQTFLRDTIFPQWFPLSTSPGVQNKVLSMLNMKKDHSGNVVWDDPSHLRSVSFVQPIEMIPMEPRSYFRVCVVGGGIAGLSCCLEVFRLCERANIDVEVVLVEGRSRLGGRLCTDKTTFKACDGSFFVPVDLGASWIHGIEANPLAALAKEAGVDFVTASEDVVMLQPGMREIDPEEDEKAGVLFDKLLDLAANDCWKLEDETSRFVGGNQAAVRWYGSVLGDSAAQTSDRMPIRSKPPPHRQSTDISLDAAIAEAILKNQFSEFALLSPEERRVLAWNLKNIEYALGANAKDLSMKFWDIDERHAFEGDHVLLRQGYSSVIDHLLQLLKKHEARFRCLLNFPVGSIEYNRKTTTQPYIDVPNSREKLIELSDTCCVTSQDGSRCVKSDFVVSAVPLGVLKSSIQQNNFLRFNPPLPFLKRDAINSVGFGLLNKIYLQFAHPFWETVLGEHQSQFGNASGLHPHHYMFVDIGKTLLRDGKSPAILMTLVSGKEAVVCEKLSDEALVEQLMEVLRSLFSLIDVPEPVAFKITRWGSDPFARGSYTFLAPGTTDQDFEMLQSPVNGNGDSLQLEGTEIMRLFMAGEHTTALHPSMAHGALLSGVRAAKEVVDSFSIALSPDDNNNFDCLIPLAMFRYMNPKKPLLCSLCHQEGARIREGNLLAFKRGNRQILVHNNCAEFSPEVEVTEGRWRNVLAAVSRSRSIECCMCSKTGASIGCAHESCGRCFHFSCSEDTGWRFDYDGKEFFCDLHRIPRPRDVTRISIKFYASKNRNQLFCCLCSEGNNPEELGELLAFQRCLQTNDEFLAVHENCARYTSIVDVGEDPSSRFDKDFRNIFTAMEHAQKCSGCEKFGATIACSNQSCSLCYHYRCAEATGWSFKKRGQQFCCALHKEESSEEGKFDIEAELAEMKMNKLEIEDNMQYNAPTIEDVTSTLDIPLMFPRYMKMEYVVRGMDAIRLVRISRKSLQNLWNFDLYATTRGPERGGTRVLAIASSKADEYDPLFEGDLVRSINGVCIGSSLLDTVEKVLAFLSREIEILIEVESANSGA